MLVYYLVVAAMTVLVVYIGMVVGSLIANLLGWMLFGYRPADTFRIFFKEELTWALQPWRWRNWRRKHWEED